MAVPEWSEIARSRWKDAAWIEGDGEWATLARCRFLTVDLYKTSEEAQTGKTWIDYYGCGEVSCHHEVVHLALASRKVRTIPVVPVISQPVKMELILGETIGYVYRLWDDRDKCLYVGQTKQAHPLLRVMQHKSKSWWPDVIRVDYVEVCDLSLLDETEIRQIRDLNPVHNVRRLGYCKPEENDNESSL
jgi:hypothetical protein